MRAKPNYCRLHINIPADLAEWGEAEAMRQTLDGGGRKVDGGKGVFGISDVITRLMREERYRIADREKKREQRQTALLPPDYPPDPECTVCLE